MEDSHKEAAALSVMRQDPHAAFDVHGLDILLREDAWHQLVMSILRVSVMFAKLALAQPARSRRRIPSTTFKKGGGAPATGYLHQVRRGCD